jgi:hypothetical protein
MLAGLICASAVILGSFALLCLGTAFGGLYAAAHQSYRFAAADTASEAFRPKAISWVLTGGVLAGIFGPQLIILTKNRIISSRRAIWRRPRSRSSPERCSRWCAFPRRRGR